jgi:hypothetical protein
VTVTTSPVGNAIVRPKVCVALDQRGVIKYAPGHGRNARARISFPAPPDDPVDNDTKHEQDEEVFDAESTSDND